MDSIAEAIKENESYIIKARRHLHAHPELSGKEVETRKFIQNELKKMDIDYEVVQGNVIGTLNGVKQGKTIAIRGDFDALPITEQTGLEFKSQNEGVMHACGHDCHTSILLGAAKVLSGFRDKFNGCVKFVFQEGEELATGAKNLTASGKLDGIDNIIGLHVEPGLKVGNMNVGYGSRASETEWIIINLKGKGGHASKPSENINPIVAGNEIINEVNAMYNYEIDKKDFVTLVPTCFEAADKYNIIPEKAKLVYDTRYYNQEYEDIIKEKMDHIVKNVCERFGVEYDIEYKVMVKVVVNEKTSVDRMYKVIDQMDELNAKDYGPASGGEDFAFFLTKYQGAFGFIGSGKTDHDQYGLHNAHMVPDEGVLRRGTEFEVRYALDFLKD